jgi:hypothetical protein
VRTSARRAAVTFLSLASLALAACNKPKVGGKCDVGQALCEDAANVIACQGGVFVEAHCRGPGGCSKLGTKVSCDDSVAVDGETCIESGVENRACSVDKKTALLCTQGKFKTVEACRGPKGCAVSGDVTTCDSKLAEKGDLCTTAGAFACTSDTKARVVCKDGAFAFDRFCKGPSGCHPADFACDESISELGDPCGVPGMFACSTSGDDELVCQGGQYAKDHKCKRPGCSVLPGGRIQCP